MKHMSFASNVELRTLSILSTRYVCRKLERSFRSETSGINRGTKKWEKPGKNCSRQLDYWERYHTRSSHGRQPRRREAPSQGTKKIALQRTYFARLRRGGWGGWQGAFFSSIVSFPIPFRRPSPNRPPGSLLPLFAVYVPGLSLVLVLISWRS